MTAHARCPRCRLAYTHGEWTHLYARHRRPVGAAIHEFRRCECGWLAMSCSPSDDDSCDLCDGSGGTARGGDLDDARCRDCDGTGTCEVPLVVETGDCACSTHDGERRQYTHDPCPTHHDAPVLDEVTA